MNTNHGFTVMEVAVAGLFLAIIGGMLWIVINTDTTGNTPTSTVSKLQVSPAVTTPSAPTTVVKDPSSEIVQSLPLTTIDVFFHDDNKFHTPNVNDYTTAVKRSTTRTDVATFAIEQLIEGPTQEEQDAGLVSLFGNNDFIKFTSDSNCSGNDFSLSISDKIATVTFCRAIQLGGDQTGMMIRHQFYNTLTQFPTVEKVRILDYKDECFDNLSGLSGGDCIYPQPEVVQVIESASISDRCTVDIKTNKIAHTIDMDAQTGSSEGHCKSFKTLDVSADGRNLAYVDISGGIDSMLVLYSLEHEAIYALDILGTSTIRDIKFLPDGRLAVVNGYKGSYDEQWLTIYDIPTFVAQDTLPTDRAASQELVVKTSIDTPPINQDFLSLGVDHEALYVYGSEDSALFSISLDSF